MKNSQKGFTLAEGLLSVLTVAIIFFVGFYVYNSQKDKDTDDLKAAKTSQETKSDASPKGKQYLNIKELGIKIEVTSELKGLNYSILPPDDNTAGLTTDSFEQAIAECLPADPISSSFPAIGAVSKIDGQYDSNAMPADVFSEFAKQFSSFYITYGSGDGGVAARCADNNPSKVQKAEQLFGKLSPALKKAVQNARQL